MEKHMIDSVIANEWIVNSGQRKARERLAHIICEIAQSVALVPQLWQRCRRTLIEEFTGELILHITPGKSPMHRYNAPKVARGEPGRRIP